MTFFQKKLYLIQSQVDLIGTDKIMLFGEKPQYILYGDDKDISLFLAQYKIEKYERVSFSNNSKIPLYNDVNFHGRIEPGAIIREGVVLQDKAIVLMNAVINIGAKIGSETMIDMGAVIGSSATIGRRCHIGANAVIAGVLEPPSAQGVVIEDNCFIGANAVVLEGVHIGEGSIIGALTLVNKDIPPHSIVMGIPGRIVGNTTESAKEKCKLNESLR